MKNDINTYKPPPGVEIWLGHAVGTGLLGAFLPGGENLQGLHAFTQNFLQWIPGAISISNKAPDPIFAQVFLALSLSIAICLLIGAVWHVSRGGYHSNTFENKKKWWKAYLFVLSTTTLGVLILWTSSYRTDGAETRAFFLTSFAISSKFGVLTIMNQLIVGGPFALFMTGIFMPFCTTIRKTEI